MLGDTYADELWLEERQAGRRQPEGWQGEVAGKREEEGWAFREPGEAVDSSTASCIAPRAHARDAAVEVEFCEHVFYTSFQAQQHKARAQNLDRIDIE